MTDMVLNARSIRNIYRRTDPLTPNAFPVWAYEKAGITCKTHYFRKNEYIYNGVKYDLKDANRLMNKLGWTIEYGEIPDCNGLKLNTIHVYHDGKLCKS